MSFRVHGLVYVRVETDEHNEEDAVRAFKEQHPDAEIQGIEPQDGEYIQFIGTCEVCNSPVFQNNNYQITETGVIHAECHTIEYAI